MKKFILVGVLIFSVLISQAQYIVDRNGGCNDNGAGTTGTLAWCLTQVAPGETITINTDGPITHADGNGCGAAASTQNNWTVNAANVTIEAGVGFNPVIDGSLLDDVANGNEWKVHVLQLAADGTTLDGLAITGAPTRTDPLDVPPTTQYGFGVVIVNGVNNTEVLNCEIYENDGVGIGHDIWNGGDAVVPLLATNLDISNCEIYSNGNATTGGSGIHLSWFEDVTIEDCNVYQNADHGVLFDGGYKTCAGCILGVSSSTVQNNSLIQNGLSNTTGGGLTLEDESDQNLITGNDCSGNAEHGIWLRQDCDDNDIIGNTCNNNGRQGANFSVGINLALGGCDNNLVQGNTCDDNENHGIYIYNTTGVDNTGNILEFNNVTNNDQDGIQILNSTGNIVRFNNVGTPNGLTDQGNDGSGIYLTNSANSNEIYFNTIIFNADDGIHLDEGNTETPFSSIEITIPPGSSSSNYIYSNKVGINQANAAAGNLGDGINVTNCDGNFIGEDPLSNIGANYVSNNGRIDGFGNGITLDGSNSNRVVGNIVGLDTTGTADMGNLFEGISVTNASLNNVIGDGVAGGGNIVSGNGQNSDLGTPSIGGNGISLTLGSDGNSISNNYVGLAADGQTVIPNGQHGIDVSGALNTIIGGAGTLRNYIAGNGDPVHATWASGIIIQNASSGTEVLNNYIGLDINEAPKGNQNNGVSINGSTNNTIGSPGLGNIISGHNGVGDVGVILLNGAADNTLASNHIGVDELGTTPLANADGIIITGNGTQENTVGGTTVGDRNIIAGNQETGISITDTARANVVQGNFIGLDKVGDALGNTSDGVYIGGLATSNIVGQGNVISNNAQGIEINGADSNFVQGNLIGTDTLGTSPMPNLGNGVFMIGSSDNTIGGALPDERNVISGNLQNGVSMTGGEDNLMVGNYVGVDESGALPLPNQFSGVRLAGGTTGNQIGGAGDSLNVISANLDFGVSLTGAPSNTLRGNIIGLDANGTSALGNEIDGVRGENGSNFTLFEANVISGNERNGVDMNASTNASFIDNIIGLNLSGVDTLGNDTNGVVITNGSSFATFTGNTISGNGSGWGNALVPAGHGVYIESSSDIQFYGNNIGTDVTGVLGLGNAMEGIYASNSDNMVVGGVLPNERNIISGNGDFDPTDATQFCAGSGGQPIGSGIVIGNSTNANIINNLIGVNALNDSLGNQKNGIELNAVTNSTIGGSTTDHGNVISYNVFKGVVLTGSDNIDVFANLIGTDTTGTLDYGNGSGWSGDASFTGPCTGIISTIGGSGIIVIGTTNSTIGGAGEERNVLSGNTESGIWIQQGSNNNDILNNLIGTDITGLVAIPNDMSGVSMFADSDGNEIGQAGLGNVISGNGIHGIYLDPSFGASLDNTSIVENIIGLNIDQNGALPNVENGIAVINANGPTTIESNIIAGNTLNGVFVTNDADGGVTLNQNTIGINDSNVVFANGEDGVQLDNANGVQITNNTIAGNTIHGIALDESDNTEISDNFIGTTPDSTSTDLGNGTNGIFMEETSNNSNVFQNTIAYNQVAVIVSGNGTNQNTISQNSMFCNDLNDEFSDVAVNGGIDLQTNGNDGFTEGTLGFALDTMQASIVQSDPDIGGNSSFNLLHSLPTGYILEVFIRDTECENCRQGMDFQFAITGDGSIIENRDIGTNANCEDYVYTITDDQGNTSEFSTCSNCFCAIPPPVFDPVPEDTLRFCVGGSAGTTLSSGNDPSAVDFEWFSTKDGVTGTSTGETTETFSVPDPGAGDTTAYFFTISTTVNGQTCEIASDLVTVIHIDNATAFAGSPDSICFNQDYTLAEATVDFDSTFSWRILNGSGTFVDAALLNPVYQPVLADTGQVLQFELTALGFGGCGPAVDTVELYYAQAPTLDIGSIDDICASTGTVLRVTYTGDTANLRWNHDGLGVLDTTNKAEPTYTSAPADAGNTITITATVDGIAGCLGGTDTETFDVSPSPTIDAGTADPICYTENGVVDLSTIATPPVSAGNVSITWTLNGGSGSYNGTQNDDEPVYTLGAADSNNTFWLVAEVEGPTSGDCRLVRDSVELTVNGDLVVEAGQPFDVCQLNAVNLDTASVLRADTANAQSFSWAISPLGSGAFDDATAIRPVFTPDPAFTGTVTLTLSAVALPGCTDDDDATTIEVDGQPTVEMVPEAEICSSDGFYNLDDAAVAVTNEGTLSWITSGAGGFDDDTDVDPIYTIGATDIGDTVDLTLTVTSANGICASVDSTLRLAVSEELVLDPLSDLGPICEVASISSGTVTGTFTTLYWSTDGGGTFTEGVNEATYNSVVGDAPSVTITVRTDTVGSCASQSEQFDITINGSPTPEIDGPDGVCEGETANYTVVTPNANTFLWEATGGTPATPSITATDVTFDNTSPALVIVTETDGAGCSNKDTLEVTVDLLPIVSLDPLGSVCEGEDVIVPLVNLTSSATTHLYSWTIVGSSGVLSTAGPTNINLGPLNDGDVIQVEVTAQNNCDDTSVPATVAAVVQALPVASVDNPGTICAGESTTITATETSGVGTPSYSWTGPEGFTSSISSPQVSVEGDYTVIVTVNGCDDMTTATLNVTTPAEITAQADPTVILQGSSSTLTANPGLTDTDYIYTWDTGEQGQSISVSPLSTTTYSVSQNLAGCEDATTVTVEVVRPISPPNVITPPESGEVGDGDNDTWILDGIETHPNATIKVFNRWGDVVYNGKGGDDYILDPFDGTRNGNDLPLATYWYVIENLEYPEGVTFPDKLNGSVTIIR